MSNLGTAREAPRSIPRARSDYARRWHKENDGSHGPEVCGRYIHEQMCAEFGSDYASQIALDDCIRAGHRAQEEAWVKARQSDVDLLGDSYLDAPVRDLDGNFTKVRYTTAEFHDSEREEQIKNLRKVNASFERDERRRDLLRQGGLWETDGMTTEQAAWKAQVSQNQ